MCSNIFEITSTSLEKQNINPEWFADKHGMRKFMSISLNQNIFKSTNNKSKTIQNTKLFEKVHRNFLKSDWLSDIQPDFRKHWFRACYSDITIFVKSEQIFLDSVKKNRHQPTLRERQKVWKNLVFWHFQGV